MSPLPKWIETNMQFKGQTRLEAMFAQALSIAWEALSEHKDDVYATADCFDYKREFCKCREAMRRIEEMGK